MNTPLPGVLTLENLSLERDGRALWTDLNLTVRPGEIVAVVGPSGAGKTTLLRAVLGLQPVSRGTITVLGKNPKSARGNIGYVPQQSPFPVDTAARGREIVGFGLTGTGWGFPVSRRVDRDRTTAVLQAVGADAFADRRVGELSGGEQQRLRIGQAIVDRPALLLCDEPLSNLDEVNRRGILDLLAAQRAETKMAVIIVTHDLEFIEDLVTQTIALGERG